MTTSLLSQLDRLLPEKSLCNCFFEEKNFKSKNYFVIILDALRWCCTSLPASKRSLQMSLYTYQNQQKGRGLTVYHLLLRFSPNFFLSIHVNSSSNRQLNNQNVPALLFSIDNNPKKHVSKTEYNRHAPWPLMRKFLFSRFQVVLLFRRLVRRQSTSDWNNKRPFCIP